MLPRRPSQEPDDVLLLRHQLSEAQEDLAAEQRKSSEFEQYGTALEGVLVELIDSCRYNAGTQMDNAIRDAIDVLKTAPKAQLAKRIKPVDNPVK